MPEKNTGGFSFRKMLLVAHTNTHFIISLKYIENSMHTKYQIPNITHMKKTRKKYSQAPNERTNLHNQLKNYFQLDGRKFVVIIMVVVVVRYFGIQNISRALDHVPHRIHRQ